MSELSIRMREVGRKESQLLNIASNVSNISNNFLSIRSELTSEITRKQNIFGQLQEINRSIESLKRGLHESSRFIGKSVYDYMEAERRLEREMQQLATKYHGNNGSGYSSIDAGKIKIHKKKPSFLDWIGSGIQSGLKHINNFFDTAGEVINNAYKQVENYLCDAVEFLDASLETFSAYSTKIYLQARDSWPTWEDVKNFATDSLDDFKDYIGRSVEQIILGNFTDEVTILGTVGQIALGILGVDLIADIRDLASDFVKWEWSWGHAGQVALDAIALLPVIGALKNADEVGTLIKGVTKTDGLVDGMKTMDKTIDTAKTIENVSEGFDSAKDGIKTFDHVSDGIDSAEEIADGTKAAKNSIDGVDSTSDVVKGTSKAISEADRLKLSKWTYKPSDELYLKYKKVFDDPTYYDQATGSIHWPKNDGFLSGSKIDIDVDEKMVFKRYGEPSGEFLGNATDSFDSRALAPHSNGAKEYFYRPTEKFKITSGNAAPWFGSNGGGSQFVKYKPDGNKYSIQEMLNLGLLEDITEKVKKGVVKID